MENWQEKFGLVTTRRKAASDTEFWSNRAAFHFLTREVAMPAEKWTALKPWEKHTARAAARALASKKAVVAGRAAARLLGIGVHAWNDPVVDLLLPEGKTGPARSLWPPGVVFRKHYLPLTQIYRVHGLRVTNVTRTLRDITCWYGVLEGVVAMDAARKKWPELTKGMLWEGMIDGPRYKGKADVQNALELSVTNSGSPKESHARYLLLTSDIVLESLELQAEIIDPETGETYYVDFLINGWLVLEIDGDVKYDGVTYGRTDATIRAERQREKAIQNTGKVMRRTDDPAEAVSLVRAALTRAA
ncbi:MAG: hypothetical protein Q4G50_14195 [Corynebacterium sp.]|uniref:hypothetical protein n=1 Tax=Corynebacterium sp. TaxID=1720 RepID=UPI0026E096D5|nr:hypothetical protein [Corynebacterium sp.]MDO5671137.1 hypothetical protein [Corynebacterium sp.]